MKQTLRGMHTPRRTKEGSCAAVRRRAKSGSLPLKIEGAGVLKSARGLFFGRITH